MKITHLLNNLNEFGPRTAAQQSSMQSAAGEVQANNPFNLKVIPGGQSAEVDTTTATPGPAGTTAPSALDRLKQGASAVGTGIVKGAQAVAKNAPAVGQGVSNVAQGLGTAGTGIVKGAGDIASQAVGGATQAVGAGLGGIVHGYKAARGGQQFGGGGAAGTPSSASASGTPSSSNAAAGGGDELDQLKSTLQTMDQRLRRAGI